MVASLGPAFTAALQRRIGGIFKSERDTWPKPDERDQRLGQSSCHADPSKRIAW